MSDPWEEDHSLGSGYRSDWGHYGNGNPMTRGEFYARQEILYKHLEELNDRMDRVENVMSGPKNFFKDLWTSVWGRIIIIITTIILFLVADALNWQPLRRILDSVGL